MRDFQARTLSTKLCEPSFSVDVIPRLEKDSTDTKLWRGTRRASPKTDVHIKTARAVPTSDRWYRVHAYSDDWYIP